MSKDILGMYGPDRRDGSRSTCGGDMTDCVKDVNKYKPPVGPSNINDRKGPGLHGTNHGNAGTQGKR
jgi:hypothetical protein